MSPSRHSCFMENGVYNRLVEAAKKRNMSVYKYTNELVSRALDLEESGIFLENVRSYALVLESLSKYKGRIAVLPFDAVLNTEVSHWEGLGRGLGLLLRQMGRTKEELASLAASAIKFVFQFMGEVSYGEGVSISFPFLHAEMQKRLVQFAKAFVTALSNAMGIEVEVREEESGLEAKFKASRETMI